MRDSIIIGFIKTIRRKLLGTIGTSNLEKIVVVLAKGLGVNLLPVAYHQNGILKYKNNNVSGEKYVIESVLKKYFPDEEVTIFDVGAHIGNYSKEIKQAFPYSKIYAFEPNIYAFKSLDDRLSGTDIERFCVGLSSSTSKQEMYIFASKKQSQLTSLYKKVLSDLHRADEILEIEIETISLDEFCEKRKIEKINFLKIDTEGHELEVIIGAKKMISAGKIEIIQFEFNEMNVVSRVFLKDFYDELIDYNIYRIDSSRLIPLFDYSSSNEIFQFQNFLAIKKSLELDRAI